MPSDELRPRGTAGRPDPLPVALLQVEVAVDEEVDLATLPALRDRLQVALARRPRRLVLDLSACPFFDVCGLSLLVEVQAEARRRGSELVVRGASPTVRRMVRLTGLTAVVPLEP